MTMMVHQKIYLLMTLLIIVLGFCDGLISPEPVSSLLEQHATTITKLKEQTDTPSSDIFFLRFCLADDPDTALKDALEWRRSDLGKRICETAYKAVTEASEGGWKNDIILSSAPHSNIISKYITPANCITTTSNSGDLVYCIRAGAIDDTSLMNSVTVEQMVEFFLYVKEVNAIVADMRSTEQLISVITCNDLSNVKLVGGSTDFRKALSESSKISANVYPSTAGPTLLLNLPILLNALVKLFTPLFPDAVKARLKFQQGLLKNVDNLRDVASTSTSPARAEFLQMLDKSLQS